MTYRRPKSITYVLTAQNATTQHETKESKMQAQWLGGSINRTHLNLQFILKVRQFYMPLFEIKMLVVVMGLILTQNPLKKNPRQMY